MTHDPRPTDPLSALGVLRRYDTDLSMIDNRHRQFKYYRKYYNSLYVYSEEQNRQQDHFFGFEWHIKSCQPFFTDSRWWMSSGSNITSELWDDCRCGFLYGGWMQWLQSSSYIMLIVLYGSSRRLVVLDLDRYGVHVPRSAAELSRRLR